MPVTPELIVAALIAVAYPIWDYVWGWPRMLRTIRSGCQNPRLPVYWEVMGQLWFMTLVIAGLWVLAGRPWSAQGLVLPTGWRLGVTAALALVFLTLDALRTRAIARLDSEKLRRVRVSDAAMVAFAPHTRAEYAWFQPVAVTAGICEELVYRGFLVWAFQPWLTLWGAVLVSLVSFAFAHAYQGRQGVVSAGAIGAIFAALAILTGSILPGMVLHTLTDLLGAKTSYVIFRDPGAGDTLA